MPRSALWTHPVSCPMGVTGSSRRMMQQVCEDDHAPTFSTEVNNG